MENIDKLYVIFPRNLGKMKAKAKELFQKYKKANGGY